MIATETNIQVGHNRWGHDLNWFAGTLLQRSAMINSFTGASFPAQKYLLEKPSAAFWHHYAHVEVCFGGV